MKRLQDLVLFQKQNPDLFLRCLDLCSDKVPLFMQLFGYDLRRLRLGIPDEKEFEKLLSRGFVRKDRLSFALDLLYENIDKAMEQIARSELDIDKLTYDNFDVLEQRINFETLQNGFLGNRKFLTHADVICFIFSNSPQREDYMDSGVIRPNEYYQVINRFGHVGILCSLPPGKLSDKLLGEVERLGDFLDSLDLGVRIKPKEVQERYLWAYKSARKLFKRYEWAVKDLCGHGLRNVVFDEREGEERRLRIYRE